MKYIPLCLTICATFYLFIHNMDGWGWGIFFSLILAGSAYGTEK
ncbi:hypothetical protein Q7301_07580 [Glaesserella parasuis]|nr:hypothetical protein [Glaesserella parasuis]MDP0243205.1 hypothetical protein [Glaesserella parasuis]